MISNETYLIPLNEGSTAFETAEFWYAQHRGVSLADDLAHYLQNGIVIARSDILWMAKLVQVEGEKTWFIRFACGDLDALLRSGVANLTKNVTKIAFCRKNGEKIRKYSLRRLYALGMKGS